MRYPISRTLGTLTLLAWALCSSSAQAGCTEEQIRALYNRHMTVTKIADRCDMSRADVQQIVDESTADSDGDRTSHAVIPPVQQRIPMCCDAWGNRRCTIVTGVANIGSPCFCYGQGSGITCQ